MKERYSKLKEQILSELWKNSHKKKYVLYSKLKWCVAEQDLDRYLKEIEVKGFKEHKIEKFKVSFSRSINNLVTHGNIKKRMIIYDFFKYYKGTNDLPIFLPKDLIENFIYSPSLSSKVKEREKLDENEVKARIFILIVESKPDSFQIQTALKLYYETLYDKEILNSIFPEYYYDKDADLYKVKEDYKQYLNKYVLRRIANTLLFNLRRVIRVELLDKGKKACKLFNGVG